MEKRVRRDISRSTKGKMNVLGDCNGKSKMGESNESFEKGAGKQFGGEQLDTKKSIEGGELT